ncbi:MAG: DEAD/DEAH box helicase [Acidobacteria bacterium]|nr:DEAD/DEAH box helicase [Acidobacteriota bacterium]
MSTLVHKVAAQVPQAIRTRGNDLSWRGQVKILEARPDEVKALVRGTLEYNVELKYSGGELRVQCECPYFEGEGRCKHIWAALVTVDGRKGLEEAKAAYRLAINDELGWEREPERREREPAVETPQEPAVKQDPRPVWEAELETLTRLGTAPMEGDTRGLPGGEFEILYVLDAGLSERGGNPVIEVMQRARKRDGEWSALKEYGIPAENVAKLPEPVDREALSMLQGSLDTYGHTGSLRFLTRQRVVPEVLAQRLLPMLAEAGRLWMGVSYEARRARPLGWDRGEPWRFRVEVKQDERDQWRVRGVLARGTDRMGLGEVEVLMRVGLLVVRGKLARFEHGGATAWLEKLRAVREITFPDRQRDAALKRMLEVAALPELEVDEPLRFEKREVAPRLGLRIRQKKEHWGEEYFAGRMLVDYGLGWVEQSAGNQWMEAERVLVMRDAAAEAAGESRLRQAGARPGQEARSWRVAVKGMPKLVRELVLEGWHVEAEGKAFRKPGASRLRVKSGVDWFDLEGEVDFGGISASLPELLAALRRGDGLIRLGDGTFGMLPEEWLARLGTIAGMGQEEEAAVRFQKGQAGLLDALLAAEPESSCDEAFEKLRASWSSFGGIRPAEQPQGFSGTLREYQKAGLGWIEFLREFGFGGCLADDMGVGKTAQVLAALEQRRVEGAGPSLVVAPKSLMFNWRQEAEKFTPSLRVLEHTGLERDVEQIGEYDLVLTTYGTLRRDVVEFKDIEFDYVILDEAQAIKNAATGSAKAARLLKGRHRLALSGTPVENHLGELWSLFEFLNPGMLGEARALKLTGGLARNPDVETRKLLAHALRPFILRRTKRQVASELPEKTEQTVYCEMGEKQRKAYDDLRQHYRQSLLARIDRNGLSKSKVHVLEALLRLRQAACHPALLDPKYSKSESAKFEELFERLEEIREEGHKALVFSQFTSLLELVRARLDGEGVEYAYLDGATRDRQAAVERFQNSEECGLFLISLKAGGLGLNLTAAEYVFLLDPWWNPAVEAQAVDRAHRIGQTKNVFAYRLIAKGTVEEKVLELQKTKRELAESIIGEDNSLIRDLKREDLELLLS